ncbi:hypothetical protein ACFQDG_11080 [Natronoarchaeum mannanilyticum]|uniref:Uncharacterized protein n=1 Tax=Natronoarchaeum mannanilyticum TaxID=926360 RepID=A0AAV3T6N0_9EURY
MSTETADGRESHLRSVTITTITALAGVGAAIASAYIAGDVSAGEAAKNQQAQLVVLAAIVVQYPLFSVMGYDDFGGVKDYLFVAFMTFSLWFITWGIILMTGVTF